MTEILYKQESYDIVGACMKIHSKLGPGFLESVYAEALEIEFKKQGIPYEREKKLELMYEGIKLKKFFKADFVCYEKIIIELKSKSFLAQIDQQQTINYLRATDFKLGILINFGENSLNSKRFVNSSVSRNS